MLAQSVERLPHNREVVGSIPGRVIPKDVNNNNNNNNYIYRALNTGDSKRTGGLSN